MSSLFLPVLQLLICCLLTVESSSVHEPKVRYTSDRAIIQKIDQVLDAPFDVISTSVALESPYILWNENRSKVLPGFVEPKQLYSVNGVLDVSLTIEPYRFVNDLFSINVRAFCYQSQCSHPGPTFNVMPGDILKVTITNLLNKDTHSHVNRTNFYIRELHLDPSINTMLSYTEGGGDSLRYEYTIPNDQTTGLHWYHSRVSDVSALQVMGGLAGAIYVRPYQDSDVPLEIQLMKRKIVVLTHLMADSSQHLIGGTAQDGGQIAFTSVSYKELSKDCGSTMPANITYLNNTVRDGWFVNGLYQPQLTVTQGEWIVFDIVVASSDRIVQLQLGSNSISKSCDVRLLALDGTYLLTSRKLSSPLPLFQGSRASIAFMCNIVGVFSLNTTSVVDFQSDQYAVGSFETKSIQPLLFLDVQSIVPGQVMPSAIYPPPSDLSKIPKSAVWSSPIPSTVKSIAQVLGVSSNVGINNGRGVRVANNETTKVEIWSIGTDQRGASIMNTTLTNQNYIIPERFWFGTGLDCVQPCFDDTHCNALFGSNYTAKDLPCSNLGLCLYENDLNRVIKGLSAHVTKGLPQLITVWGSRSQYFLPISIEGAHFQVLSNYLNEQRMDLSLYGHYDGSWRDTWPILPGKTVIATIFDNYDGSRQISTGFLKYENRGMRASIFVDTTNDISSNDKQASADGIKSSSSAPVELKKAIFSDPDPRTVKRDQLCDPNGFSSFYSERIDYDKFVRVITTSSCPNHFSVCQEVSCAQNYSTLAMIKQEVYEIPLYPVIATTPLDATCLSTPVAIALNGVPIMSPSEKKIVKISTTPSKLTPFFDDSTINDLCGSPGKYGQASEGRTACGILGETDSTLYCGDVLPLEGHKFDKCNGHADPVSGHYHYHSVPSCLLKQLTLIQYNKSKEIIDGRESSVVAMHHSPQLGWALDGFPVFGPLGPKGISMIQCKLPGAHPQMCLDLCNGYQGLLPGYDLFTYRYYMPGDVSTGLCSDTVRNTKTGACNRRADKCCNDVVPSQKYFPYSVGCFKGCLLQNSQSQSSCIMSSVKGTAPNYVPILALATSSISTNVITTATMETANQIYLNPSSLAAQPQPTAPTSPPTSTPTSMPAMQQVAKAAALKQRETMQQTSLLTSKTGNMAVNGMYTAIRNPVDRSISVVTLSHPTISQVGSTPGTARIKHVSTGSADAYITSVVSSEQITTNPLILYFTTQFGLYSVHTITKSVSNLIAGIVEISISGYNFGKSIDYINYINIRNIPCTSIVLHSQRFMTCLSVKEDVVGNDLQASDVVLSTLGGDTRGIYSQAEAVYHSGSGRPIIANITFQQVPFIPLTLALSPFRVQSSLSPSQSLPSQVLYWSNVGVGSYSIQRAQLDGSQLETVINNVQKVSGMVVVSGPTSQSELDALVSTDVIFFIEVVTSSLYRLKVPSMICHISMPFSSIEALDTSESETILQPKTLQDSIRIIGGLQQASALAVDVSSNVMVITTFDGTLIKVDYSVILAAKSVTIIDLERKSTSFPSWITVLLSAPSKARFRGLGIVPLAIGIPNTPGLSTPKSLPWDEQRVFVVDSNQQLLFAVSHAGHPVQEIDPSMSHGLFSVKWPCSISIDHSQPITVNSSLTIYVSEYLGDLPSILIRQISSIVIREIIHSPLQIYVTFIKKNDTFHSCVINPFSGRIWRLRVQRDVHGVIANSAVATPELIVDKSSFPASATLRQFLQSASDRGLKSYDHIAFEIFD